MYLLSHDELVARGLRGGGGLLVSAHAPKAYHRATAQVLDVLEGAAEGARVRKPGAVALLAVVEMGIELHDMHGAAAAVGTQQRVAYRVVAADEYRQGGNRSQPRRRLTYPSEGTFRVELQDVHVAGVGDVDAA